MVEYVILVNEADKEIGVEEKIKAHKEGKLHRAFSIFIFNSKNQILLQKRHSSKYHSGGLWSNACCSHPRPGEDINDAVHRRLKEEMGFDCDLKKAFSFIYKAEFDNGIKEYEYDYVFIGYYDGEVFPNPEEVEGYKWIDINELKEDVSNNPDNYTIWFRIALPKVLSFYKRS